MVIPDNPLDFYLSPAPFAAIVTGLILIVLSLSIISKPKLRPYVKPLFKFYYYLVMGPLLAVAGIIYVITISKINIFQKFREIGFYEKFKSIYLEPTRIFEDMRINPEKYHLWVGIYICAVFIAIDYIFITILTEMFYGGTQSIIFGVISSNPPGIIDPFKRWVYIAIVGNLVWIPTKFTIYFLVVLFHKYDKSDEPPNRPWYDKVRLIYIAWGYIIAADMVWILGMIISLLVSIVIPSWEVLIFTWIFVIICGLMELLYQQYSLRGLFKIGWAKGFLFWLISMIPFAITSFLLVELLGPIIMNPLP
jgi:hypothetical protein